MFCGGPYLDESTAIFVGVICGLPLGIVLGWVIAQLISKPSTVVIQKLDNGYVIRES